MKCSDTVVKVRVSKGTDSKVVSFALRTVVMFSQDLLTTGLIESVFNSCMFVSNF